MTPTIVYKKNGPNRGPKGTTYDYKGVSDESQLKKLEDDGWCLSLTEAIEGKKPEVKKPPVKKTAAKKAPVEAAKVAE